MLGVWKYPGYTWMQQSIVAGDVGHDTSPGLLGLKTTHNHF